MSTFKRDDQLAFRISRALRAELEAAAQDDGRGLSSQIRKILIDYAAKRVVERTSAGAA